MQGEDFRVAMDTALPEIDDQTLDEIDVAVEALIEEWLRFGDLPCTTPGLEGVPFSPEYQYRQTGEWRGWNDLFRTAPDSENYRLHRRHDLVEDIAYGRLMTRMNGVSPRNVRKKRKRGGVISIDEGRKST